MIVAYRLSSSRYPAKSGKGAEIWGGRWTPVGAEAIYAAANPSLAALEVLVHLAELASDYVLTEIRIPDQMNYRILLSTTPRPMVLNFAPRYSSAVFALEVVYTTNNSPGDTSRTPVYAAVTVEESWVTWVQLCP